MRGPEAVLGIKTGQNWVKRVETGHVVLLSRGHALTQSHSAPHAPHMLCNRPYVRPPVR